MSISRHQQQALHSYCSSGARQCSSLSLSTLTLYLTNLATPRSLSFLSFLPFPFPFPFSFSTASPFLPISLAFTATPCVATGMLSPTTQPNSRHNNRHTAQHNRTVSIEIRQMQRHRRSRSLAVASSCFAADRRVAFYFIFIYCGVYHHF